jgi:mRNA interferase RelE/StbE
VRDYAVTVSDRAAREIEDLPVAISRRVFAALEALEKNPRPSGVKKLKGARALWRVRVGAYRIVYAIDDRAGRVDVIRVRHRSVVYQ